MNVEEVLTQASIRVGDALNVLDGLPRESQLMHRCADAFGEEHNLSKTVEECAELVVEIMRNESGRAPMDRVVEEAADVLICIAVIRALHPKAFEAALQAKLERLERRIEAEDPKAP